MSRFRVRAGSALCALVACALLASLLTPLRAAAQSIPAFWFAGTRLIFERADRVDDEIAVRTTDPGLIRFLQRVGATISYQPGTRYVVVTTAERKTLTFTLGTPTFQTGSATENAPLKAYIDGNEAYVPFLTLARALYVQPIKEGAEYVLQPQLGAMDVRVDGRKTIVTLHGGGQLRFKRSAENAERLAIVLPGAGSSLVQARRVDTPGLSQIDVVAAGTPRNPATTVTFIAPPGSVRAMYPSVVPNELVFAFGDRNVALGGGPVPLEGEGGQSAVAMAGPPATAPPLPPATVMPRPPAATPSLAPRPPPSPSVTPLPVFSATALPTATASAAGALPAAVPSLVPGPATPPPPTFVTSVDLETPAPDALNVRVALSGGAAFEWHRLPDNRFYIDLKGATLSFAPREERPNLGFVQSVRVNQLGGAAVPTVRVALTASANRRIEVVPDPAGITISVADVDAGSDQARLGNGTAGAPMLAAIPTALPSDWKFGGAPVAPPPGSNPRLIVLDPGHGGSDTGAMRNGVVEKEVTLDVAMRLRTILVARGWTVKMTRDRDVDVYGPNAADVAELQARVDAANNSGARMFVSVHVNSSTSSAPSGTTSYYYKPEDRQLAAAIQRRLIAVLGTKDDGVQKERFYVIRHTTMPATLIETAFLSNVDDAAKLKSPEFRQSLAQGIADGIRDYAGSPSGTLSQRGE